MPDSRSTVFLYNGYVTETLLQTKLYIPPRRPNLVQRPRLIDKLNAGLSGKLTLISAPAGSGKTTLLGDWISQSEIPFSWLTLEENDNDIVRFLAYFSAALQKADAGIDEQALTLLHSPEQLQTETILAPLINQVAQGKKRFALVLDDYHLVESQEVHNALAFWLEHQPPAMHLVIASRSDPPLPLARMRVGADLTEVRVSDLRFSLEEGEQLLNQVLNLGLAREDIQALIKRTEGWIAGLQMASIALQGKTDRSAYIQGFSGSHEYVADYLRDEVMGRQSRQLQEFLLTTSILDRLSSQLCDAVTDRTDSRQLLGQIKASNLFLTPLDDEGQWFRYHRLFADLLHQRLLESQASEVPSLYLKASEWFEDNGFPAEAIEYALRGGKFGRAAALIEEEAEPTVKRSEIATFKRWIDRMPDDLVRGRASLAIFYAWALLISDGQTHMAESYLNGIIPENGQIAGRLKVVKALLAMYQRQVPRATTLARQALAELPEDDLFFRSLAAWNLSASLHVSGDREGGEKVLVELAQMSRQSGNTLVAVITLCRLASARMQGGKLHNSQELFQQALELAINDQGKMLPIACEALIGLGTIHWQWNELDSALNYLLKGIELSKRWRGQNAITGYVTLAQLKQAQGEISLAEEMIERARELAAKTDVTEADDHYVALQQAQLWIRQGKHQAAERWAAGRGLGVRDYNLQRELRTTENISADLIRRYELVTLARLLIAEKRENQALELLDHLLPYMEEMGFVEKMIEIHILQAIAFQGLGKIDQAVSTLTGAISLAKPESYIRLFVDEGPAISSLLKEIIAQGGLHELKRSPPSTKMVSIGLVSAVNDGGEVEFARKVVAALPGSQSISRMRSEATEVLEPLSERESEVLYLLQSELTVPEMAEKLYLAVSTVRSHVKSIYGKLGVHSRFEAVSKAEDIGLL